MQSYFYELIDYLEACLPAGREYNAYFDAEDSAFVRLTEGAMRQSGTVFQRYLWLDIIAGRRHVSGTTTVAGNIKHDRHRVRALLERLDGAIDAVPEDPHLLLATEVSSSELRGHDRLPDNDGLLEAILEAAAGHDLVGYCASGPMHAGFASSTGQRNWFSTYTFHVDWSIWLEADRGVKGEYSGEVWDASAFQHAMAESHAHLEYLRRSVHTLEPGRYRAYLAPEALQEIVGMASVGFGIRALRNGRSPLLRMDRDDLHLHPSVSMAEDAARGSAPNFDSRGFIRPDRVPLIHQGELAGRLVSPSSAAEYGVETNGARAREVPVSLDMQPGDLHPDDVLARLDRGLYLSRLHYLNWSDRTSARLTGLTRFACFWVEDGKIAAPIPVMRFDESALRLLGENLVALTSEARLMFDPTTYGQRSTVSQRVPGALVKEFTLTL